MLLVDFKNIGNIKNLKNNKYVEPTHKVSIDNIPRTILGGFNYSDYRMKPPYPNESMKTISELIKLSNTPSDDEFTLKMDNVVESFKGLCEAIGVDYPYDMVSELNVACGAIILDLKYHFNRPRPYKLAPLYNIELDTNKIKDTTSDSAAYPSGHAAQATLISNYLSNKYPLHRGEFLKLGRDISKSRIIAKVHYHSDVYFGEQLGNDIFQYIKQQKLI